MSDKGKSIPGWVWVTTPALAAAFAGFLFYLSTVPPGKEIESVRKDASEIFGATVDKVKEGGSAVEQAVKNKVEQAKPAYEFYKLLENQTVNVDDVYAYTSTPKDAESDVMYILQAGSFRSAEDADRMRAQLLLEGLQAYDESSDVNGSVWHRVYVGPYTQRAQLNKAQSTLVNMSIRPLVLTRKVEQ